MKPVLALLLASSLVHLQAQRRPFMERPRRAEKGMEGAAGPLLLQLRLQRIQDALGLSEDRAKTLAERWARYDQDFMQRAKELGKLRARFNDILLSPGSEDDKNARIKPLVDQFLDLRRQQMDLKAHFEEEIRSGLTPAQQVRFILLVDDLTRQIREGIRETLREGRPAQRF